MSEVGADQQRPDAFNPTPPQDNKDDVEWVPLRHHSAGRQTKCPARPNWAGPQKCPGHIVPLRVRLLSVVNCVSSRATPLIKSVITLRLIII